MCSTSVVLLGAFSVYVAAGCGHHPGSASGMWHLNLKGTPGTTKSIQFPSDAFDDVDTYPATQSIIETASFGTKALFVDI